MGDKLKVLEDLAYDLDTFWGWLGSAEGYIKKARKGLVEANKKLKQEISVLRDAEEEEDEERDPWFYADVCFAGHIPLPELIKLTEDTSTYEGISGKRYERIFIDGKEVNPKPRVVIAEPRGESRVMPSAAEVAERKSDGLTTTFAKPSAVERRQQFDEMFRREGERDPRSQYFRGPSWS